MWRLLLLVVLIMVSGCQTILFSPQEKVGVAWVAFDMRMGGYSENGRRLVTPTTGARDVYDSGEQSFFDVFSSKLSLLLLDKRQVVSPLQIDKRPNVQVPDYLYVPASFTYFLSEDSQHIQRLAKQNNLDAIATLTLRFYVYLESVTKWPESYQYLYQYRYSQWKMYVQHPLPALVELVGEVTVYDPDGKLLRTETISVETDTSQFLLEGNQLLEFDMTYSKLHRSLMDDFLDELNSLVR